MSEQYQRPRDAARPVCLDTFQLESYCRSRPDAETIYSVELHLAECQACRLRLAAQVRNNVLTTYNQANGTER